jgi:hypothetical protein
MEVKTFYIKGRTHEGEIFRPSDWVERLCGVMSQFSPCNKNSSSNSSSSRKLTYSPYVQPAEIDGVKSVLIDTAIANIEPKALAFLYDFAKSNNLPIVLACPLEFEKTPT